MIHLKQISCLRWINRLSETDKLSRYKSGVQTNYVAKFLFD